MPFKYNPITNVLDIASTSSGPGSGILTINNISPDGGGNFTLTEGANITLTPESNGLIISATGGGSGGVTLDGDTSFATGSTINLIAGMSTQNAGSSVSFDGNGTDTLQLNVTDTNENTIIGKSSGNGSITGNINTSLGRNNLSSLTSGSSNSAFGHSALANIISGSENVAVGNAALSNSSADLNNTAVGVSALELLNGGHQNTALGSAAGANLLSGSYNLYLGNSAGSLNESTESSNIYLNALGSTDESNALRIGRGTGSSFEQLTTAFISGINGVTLGGTPLMVTIDSATDQLGVQEIPSGGSVTIEGDSGSISGSSLTIYADNAELNSGATVKFDNSGSASLFSVSDGISNNTLIGLGCGHLSSTGISNTALGAFAFSANSSANYSAVLGNGSLSSLVSGDYNVALGHLSGDDLLTGSYNLLIGNLSGHGLVGAEASNIYLNSQGVASESHTLRLGAATGTGDQELSTAFISGINGNTASSPKMVTINSLTDQLGTADIPSGIVETIDGDTGSISGSTLTIYANHAALNSGSSVEFVNSGTTSTLNVTDAKSNTMIGSTVGNLSITGFYNVGLGDTMFPALTEGLYNVGIGHQNFSNITTGNGNIGIGNGVLVNLVDGEFNICIGQGSGAAIVNGLACVAIGGLALASSTVDGGTVAIGANSLSALNGGSNNTAVGSNTLQFSTSDSDNTAIGFNALALCNGGSQNTAVGYIALTACTTGANNTAIGSNGTLFSLTEGSGNVGVGGSAGAFLLTGNNNSYLGSSAGNVHAGAESNNVIINAPGVASESNALRIGAATGTGSQELSTAFVAGINGNTLGGTPLMVVIDSSTDQLGVQTIPVSGGINIIDGDSGSITGTTVTIYANKAAVNSGSTVEFENSGTTSTLNVTDTNDNTLIGNGAGNNSLTGINNTGLGSFVLSSLTSGEQNLAAGTQSLTDLTEGLRNVGLGFATLSSLTTGDDNVAVGQSALNSLQDTSQNIAIGTGALQHSLTDSENCAIGYISFNTLNGGDRNTGLGWGAGEDLANGSYNLFLGYSAGLLNVGAESSNIYLNNPGFAAESNCLRVGAATGTGNQELSTVFISGINGNSVSSPKMVTIDPSTDQLGIMTIPSGGLVWTDEATTFSALSNNGYFCTGALLATLPASPSQGDIISFAVDTNSSVVIIANIGQTLRLGTITSTVAGSATNTFRGDTLSLVYRSADTTWFSVSSTGSWILA